MMVVAVVALMLFSPRELPKVAKIVARAYGTLRRTADEFRRAVMQNEDMREPIDEFRQALHGTRKELRKAEEMARRELAKARMDVRMAERKLREASNATLETNAQQPVAGDSEAHVPVGPRGVVPAEPTAVVRDPPLESPSRDESDTARDDRAVGA